MGGLKKEAPTGIEALLDMVRDRRSMRRFRPDEVPQESILKALEVARWAMSGANAQPWEFVVVRDKELRMEITMSWLELLREIMTIEQTRIPELRLKPLRDGRDFTPPWKDAPVLIVVLGDKRTYQATVMSASFLNIECSSDAIYHKNMANATQLLHLAISAQKLGSMWISAAPIWGNRIKKLLNIPDILDVHSVAAVGYPAYEPEPPYRRTLEEIVHHDGYDQKKYRSAADIQKFLYSLRGYTDVAYKQGFLDYKEQ